MTAVRVSARVVLLDDEGAVLLLCGSDPAVPDGSAPRWWFHSAGTAQTPASTGNRSSNLC